MENQKEALEKLSALENEAKKLRVIIENFNKPKPIMERVKTFSDACKELGINPCQITNSTLDTKDEIAYKKLKIIARALNEGWTPDFLNGNESKYYPYFKFENGKFSCCYWDSTTVTIAVFLCTFISSPKSLPYTQELNLIPNTTNI